MAQSTNRIHGKSLVLFKDIKKHESHSGILLSNNNIICLCCGGTLTPIEYQILWSNNGFAYLDDIIKDAYK